jgi:hypothetical protein
MRPERPFRVLDLYAGAGGFSAGFVGAGGYEIGVAVERDPDAAKTFRANHPDTSSRQAHRGRVGWRCPGPSSPRVCFCRAARTSRTIVSEASDIYPSLGIAVWNELPRVLRRPQASQDQRRANGPGCATAWLPHRDSHRTRRAYGVGSFPDRAIARCPSCWPLLCRGQSDGPRSAATHAKHWLCARVPPCGPGVDSGQFSPTPPTTSRRRTIYGADPSLGGGFSSLSLRTVAIASSATITLLRCAGWVTPATESRASVIAQSAVSAKRNSRR